MATKLYSSFIVWKEHLLEEQWEFLSPATRIDFAASDLSDAFSVTCSVAFCVCLTTPDSSTWNTPPYPDSPASLRNNIINFTM